MGCLQHANCIVKATAEAWYNAYAHYQSNCKKVNIGQAMVRHAAGISELFKNEAPYKDVMSFYPRFLRV